MWEQQPAGVCAPTPTLSPLACREARRLAKRRRGGGASPLRSRIARSQRATLALCCLCACGCTRAPAQGGARGGRQRSVRESRGGPGGRTGIETRGRGRRPPRESPRRPHGQVKRGKTPTRGRSAWRERSLRGPRGGPPRFGRPWPRLPSRGRTGPRRGRRARTCGKRACSALQQRPCFHAGNLIL